MAGDAHKYFVKSSGADRIRVLNDARVVCISKHFVFVPWEMSSMYLRERVSSYALSC